MYPLFVFALAVRFFCELIFSKQKMAAGNVYNFDKKNHVPPGAIVFCKTNFGEEFEGEVMGYDDEAKALIISIFFYSAKK